MDQQLIDSATNALLHKNWSAITGFVIVFLVHMAKKGGLTSKVNAKLLPVLSVGLGVLLAVGDNLISRPTAVGIYETVIKGVVAGVSATGFWELVFKHYSAAVNTPPVIPAVDPPVVAPAVVPVTTPVVPAAVVVLTTPVAPVPAAIVPEAVAVAAPAPVEPAPVPPAHDEDDPVHDPTV